MKLVEFSIKNRAVTWLMIWLIALGGIVSYQKLGRLEDPEFTIKEAVITTLYPGATSLEVEEEVTEKIETALQQLKQLHELRSISRPGLSIVFAEMEDAFDKNSLPQVWDEMRRKIKEVEPQLPPGVVEPLINDDFGDVYGVFFALTGDGYSYHDLKEIAEDIRLELMFCEDVGRIAFWGEQQEVIYVELNRTKMSSLGISPTMIFNTIGAENAVVSGGVTRVDSEQLRLEVSGGFDSLEAIEMLYIRGLGSDKLIRLGDVAEVRRGYREPSSSFLYFDSQPAIGIGISTVDGGNVVRMGRSVKARLEELKARLPVGVELQTIAFQADTVSRAVNGFSINLLEAVVIVLVVLILFMGFREGLVMGIVLLLTILGTFIGMKMAGVLLQRVSLGALIIALGMLVDNAIVVVEGIMIKTRQGLSKKDAAIETVKETHWPLLGATAIAILAFASISVSHDKTGEFLRSLFQVVGISLGLSWVLAVTVTPFLCIVLLKNVDNDASDDLYHNWMYRAYRWLLKRCVRHRWITLGSVLLMLLLSLYGFRQVPKNFFPNSSRPQFTVSLYFPEGTHIESTRDRTLEIGRYVQTLEHVTDAVAFVGKGAMRFILTYQPEMPASNYAQLLVSVDDYREIRELLPQVREYLNAHAIDAVAVIEPFKLGMPGNWVAPRIIGPDVETLYQVGAQYADIMRRTPDTEAVHTDWMNKIKTVKMELSASRSSETGVSRPDVARSVATHFTGIPGGIYREGNDLLPIMMHIPLKSSEGLDQMKDVQIWSSMTGAFLPIEQVVDDMRIEWEPSVIQRLNRKRTLTVFAKPVVQTTAALLEKIRPEIEAVELPEGYELEWGGEYENSTEANQKLGANVPAALMLMFLISVLLFNSFRHPIIIFIGLPLVMIGVVSGLLLAGQPFGFMATLGILSLFGMLIKNEIVLLEQINLEMKDGKDPYNALIHASVSRVRPVSMAALTTVLGMVPLLWDPFFGPMAVTIMAGLTFATALTLLVVPVLYTAFFHIKAHL